MKILAVEDNKTLLDSIIEELSKHFDVEGCEDGEEALYMIEQDIYDLVVLDLMLPGMNGMEILKNARNKGMIHLYNSYSKRGFRRQGREAFQTGANDYLTKPFYMEELVARVYAILRTNGKLTEKTGLQFKDMYIDTSEKRVFIGDEEITLQNKQYNLLEYFVMNRGAILLKEQIYAEYGE